MSALGIILMLGGLLLFFAALIVPILVALNVSGIRDVLYSKLGGAPGYRSGTRWKAVIGTFGYILLASIIVTTAGGLLIPLNQVQIQETSLSTGEIYSGEQATVSAVLTNNANESSSLLVSLYSNGVEIAQKQVSLGPGETGTVEFTHVFDKPGTYDIKINDVSVGSLRVKANIEIGESQLSDSTVRVGESVEIQTQVRNTGNRSDSRTVTLSVDGSMVAEKEVSLAPGESQTITFSHTFEKAGEYTLSVNGNSVSTVNVEPEPTAISNDIDTTATTSPGLPISPPQNVPGYNIRRVRDVSFGTTERIAIDVTVDGNLVAYSETELLKISKDLIYIYLTEISDVNAISIFFWQEYPSWGGAYARVVWAPGGEWENANSVETGEYSTHEFSPLYGKPYFELVEVRAPDQVTVGENFTISITIRNRGVGKGTVSGWFEDLDDNIYAEFEIVLNPGEEVTVQKTVSFQERPIVGEKTLYLQEFSRPIHNASWITINVTSSK